MKFRVWDKERSMFVYPIGNYTDIPYFEIDGEKILDKNFKGKMILDMYNSNKKYKYIILINVIKEDLNEI